ncbi:MAG TPA: hypothetical protein VFS30_11905 [Dehalococcoidia bacterium]|nr:hypothetical protein [Dehalococcoidia bacterium]
MSGRVEHLAEQAAGRRFADDAKTPRLALAQQVTDTEQLLGRVVASKRVE